MSLISPQAPQAPRGTHPAGRRTFPTLVSGAAVGRLSEPKEAVS